MVIYILIFAGWVAVWYRPTMANYNLFGLIIALWLLLSVGLAAAIAPQFSREALLTCLAYSALYLIVGAGIMLWRRKHLGAPTDTELLPKIDADKIFSDGSKLFVRFLWPIWAFSAVIFILIIPITTGQGIRGALAGLLIVLLTAAGPFVPLVIGWVVLKIIAFIRGPDAP